MDLKEKTIRKIYAYRGKIINLRSDDVELPDGSISTREVVEHSGGAVILPVTPDGRVIFVKQYRYAYGEEVLELPAGKLDPGESPIVAAARELEEETGMVAAKYYNLGKLYPSPGYTDEIISMYAAAGLKDVGQHPDPDEFLEVEILSFSEALNLIYKGEIKDAKTICTLLKFNEMQSLGKLKEVEI